MRYKRIVSIGAHPLDADVLGGPFILKESEKGAKCTLIHITFGRLPGQNITKREQEIYNEEVNKQSKKSAEILGADCISLNMDSKELPSESEAINLLCDYLKKEKVDCVITHWRGTMHLRHHYTYYCVSEAVKKLRKESINISLFYGENNEDLIGFSPTNYLTLSKELEEKWFEALQCYDIFNGKINGNPYYDFYKTMGKVRSIECGAGSFVKAYMHGALIDNY